VTPWLVSAGLAAAGAIAVLVLTLQRNTARALALAEQHRAGDLEAELGDTRRQMARGDEALARRVNVTTHLLADIDQLQEDIDACQDPAVVRDRLKRMLSDATRRFASSGPRPSLPRPPAPNPGGGVG
jgi:hypothetical protein